VFQEHIVARHGFLLFDLTQPGGDARQARPFHLDHPLTVGLFSHAHVA